MSRPVPLLFRRVSPALAARARDLVPGVAALGAQVESSDDALRFAAEVGMLVLENAQVDAAARAYARAVILGRGEAVAPPPLGAIGQGDPGEDRRG